MQVGDLVRVRDPVWREWCDKNGKAFSPFAPQPVVEFASHPPYGVMLAFPFHWWQEEDLEPYPGLGGFKFCPMDASRLLPKTHMEKVRPTCLQCGWVDWGNPKPCTAVLVQHRGKILFGKRAVDPAKGEWDILGGFMEPGETAEQSAMREVEEESGLRVRIVAYLGSFPDLYGPDDVPLLNLAFVAVLPAGTDPKSARPSSDIAELHWLAPHELPKEWPFPHQPLVMEAWRRRFT